MTGILAQLVALAAHGNHYLESSKLMEKFFPDHSTFKFCNSVKFVTFKKPLFSSKLKTLSAGDNPTDWFNYLKDDGCLGFKLYYQHSEDQNFGKDYKMAGFVGGGGTWYIQTIYKSFSYFWTSKWEGFEDENKNMGWNVSYGRAMHKFRQKEEATRTSHEVHSALKETLMSISEFSSKHELDHFKEQFDNAIRILDHPKPNEQYFHQDLLPKGHLNLEEEQLLYAASSAWVFGGMGSWNDLGFESEEEHQQYETLSERLYDDIIQSIISAVNSKHI